MRWVLSIILLNMKSSFLGALSSFIVPSKYWTCMFVCFFLFFDGREIMGACYCAMLHIACWSRWTERFKYISRWVTTTKHCLACLAYTFGPQSIRLLMGDKHRKLRWNAGITGQMSLLIFFFFFFSFLKTIRTLIHSSRSEERAYHY